VTRLVAAPCVLAALRPAAALAQPTGDQPENLFISPPGQPFRAKIGAPYPVVDWFKQVDKNADGKIDREEFNADALAFFKTLDQNHDGVISPYEVNYYELRICPEVVGVRVDLSLQDRPRLWLAQMGGGGMGGGGMGGQGGGRGGQGGPPTQGPPSQSISPPANESTQGASPFSFFDEPEPVAAADVHFRGTISRADFLTLSNAHFDALDRKQLGYLALDTLPLTPVQRQMARAHMHGRHRP
jgi:hypothetical protein